MIETSTISASTTFYRNILENDLYILTVVHREDVFNQLHQYELLEGFIQQAGTTIHVTWKMKTFYEFFSNRIVRRYTQHSWSSGSYDFSYGSTLKIQFLQPHCQDELKLRITNKINSIEENLNSLLNISKTRNNRNNDLLG